MLIEEARWFGKMLSTLPPHSVFPMLNVGSSTLRFRTVDQPWIDEYIFRPARDKGLPVYHMDLKKAPGVDLVGDLADPAFVKRLNGMKFRSVFCSNLLEHLRERERIAEILAAIVPREGYLFVSCPYQYPYHADPIDTGYRPDLFALRALFPGMQFVAGEVVTCGTYFQYATLSPRKLLKTLARLVVPYYRPRVWYSHVMHLPWLFKHFQATCLATCREPV